MLETWVQCLDWEDPMEKEMAGKSQGQRSLMDCNPKDRREADTTEHTQTHKRNLHEKRF